MNRLLLACALSILLLVAAAANQFRPAAPAQADFPAAELSLDLLFQCQPDNTISVAFTWQSSNQGPQWIDLSLSDNNFAADSFLGAGPLPGAQNGFLWDGLAPATWHYVRVNTLTPSGWFPSATMHFFTPNDCPTFVAPQAPGPVPTDCPAFVDGQLSGCVWTLKPNYAVYAIGEAVDYCYYVNAPTNLKIIATKPDQTSLVIIDGLVNATGACIGPFQANTPLGLRTVRLYAGPDGALLSETHFEVR